MAVVNLIMTKSIKSLIILAEGRNQMNVKQIIVFPQIRSAGIIFFQGLQMRVLLERGY